MSNFRLLYIGDNLQRDIAPYSYQTKELMRAIDSTEEYRKDYAFMKDNDDFLSKYPDGSFKDFLEYWDNIKIISKDQVETFDKEKRAYAVEDENGEIEKVITFLNPNGRFYNYMTIGTSDTIDWEKELKNVEDERRKEYQSAVRILGRRPKFFGNDEVVKMLKNGQFGKFENGTEEEREDAFSAANTFYREQPDRKKLAEALPFVEDNIGKCTEEEYVNKACLPYFAILTERGWYAAARIVNGGQQIGTPLSDEDWRNIQIECITAALSKPGYKVTQVNCLV